MKVFQKCPHGRDPAECGLGDCSRLAEPISPQHEVFLLSEAGVTGRTSVGSGQYEALRRIAVGYHAEISRPILACFDCGAFRYGFSNSHDEWTGEVEVVCAACGSTDVDEADSVLHRLVLDADSSRAAALEAGAEGSPDTIPNSVIAWMEDALAGRPVSDFAESFGPVLAAYDLRRRADELERSFDLRREADARAITRWRAEAPGRDLTLPDHADLCVWLLGRLDGGTAAARHLERLASDALTTASYIEDTLSEQSTTPTRTGRLEGDSLRMHTSRRRASFLAGEARAAVEDARADAARVADLEDAAFLLVEAVRADGTFDAEGVLRAAAKARAVRGV